MRIAYLSIGGHIHTERWLRYFVNSGHDVHLLTSEPAPMQGVTVHDVRTGAPWKPLHYGLATLAARRILRRIQPQVLHVHFLQGYGYISAFTGFHPRVLTVWGDDVYRAPRTSSLRAWLSRRALGGADLVTGDSRDILREAARLGADPSRQHLILWGVDIERFRAGDGGAFRRKWGIADDVPVVLSTRSFIKDYYNIDTILDAVQIALERVPDLVTVVAGYEGDDREMRAHARDRGIFERIRFTGRIDHAEMPDAMNAANVFVSVPSLDATAVSLLEAMACGRAVVVSDLPSNREWIRHGDNGYIVNPGEAGPLADRLIELIERPDLRVRFGRACEQMARDQAGYDWNMGQMEKLYRQLIDENR